MVAAFFFFVACLGVVFLTCFFAVVFFLAAFFVAFFFVALAFGAGVALDFNAEAGVGLLVLGDWSSEAIFFRGEEEAFFDDLAMVN